MVGSSILEKHESDKNACRSCRETVNLQSHQCFLQAIKEEFVKKKRKGYERNRSEIGQQ